MRTTHTAVKHVCRLNCHYINLVNLLFTIIMVAHCMLLFLYNTNTSNTSKLATVIMMTIIMTRRMAIANGTCVSFSNL